VLYAGDPCAVVGLIQAFGIHKPNIVGRIVTATSAGIELVEKMSGVPSISLPEVVPRDVQVLFWT
jgi:hypothetical protein